MEHDDPASASDTLSGSVLCIEDEPTSMELVRTIVSAIPGVRLLEACTGREGVERALAELPDLVLLDMHLPDIGGLEVVRALSPVISERKLRVVLLTMQPFSIEVVKAMSLGAHEYWPKPLTYERALDGLRRALRRSPP
ncbi:MAG: response regulator [Burkholderiales bacterium]|nr:response regulator [Burkholderiales bacterium]MDE2453673.1 response regulator [Burkholderiales bacterium]